MQGPDPRKVVAPRPGGRAPRPRRARREIVAAILGAEAGAAAGLIFLGSTPLAPLGLAVLGAAGGAGAMHARHVLFRRWVRAQLRAVR